jgi:hypothetical protein
MGPTGHPHIGLGHCLPHHMEGTPLIWQGNNYKLTVAKDHNMLYGHGQDFSPTAGFWKHDDGI